MRTVQRFVAVPLNPNNVRRLGQLAIPVPIRERVSVIEQTLIAHPKTGLPYPVNAYVYDFSQSALMASLGLSSSDGLPSVVRELRHRAIKDTDALLDFLEKKADAVELDEYHSDIDAKEWEDVELIASGLLESEPR